MSRTITNYLIILITLSVVRVPFANAEPPVLNETIPTVAIITWRGETDAERGFVKGLTRYGEHIRFIRYYAAQDLKRLELIIEQIKIRQVQLIYVFGTTATQFLISRVKTIPVVFNVVSLPVATGIIKSWEKSGNNAVGVSNKVPIYNQLKAFKVTVDFKRLGIIFNPAEVNSIAQKDQVEELSKALNFSLYAYPVTGNTDIKKALMGLGRTVDAVYIPADSLVKSLGGKIIRIVNENKIPTMTAIESMVPDDRVLLGLVASYYDLGIVAAEKARRILAGESPGAIASTTLDHFQFWVNMKTAEKIGVQIPLSTLIMADKIVR
jgi:putative ABC transport system substrate-binding protein